MQKHTQASHTMDQFYWLSKMKLLNFLFSKVHQFLSFYFFSPLQIQDEARLKVRTSLTSSTLQSALQRILPYPCKKQYTVVILMPQTSRFKLLGSVFQSTWTINFRDPKVSCLPVSPPLFYHAVKKHLIFTLHASCFQWALQFY